MHDKINTLLERMYRLKRVPQALLFYGKEGIGKKTKAFDLAKALLCLKGTFPACNTCPSCNRMNQFNQTPVEQLQVYSDKETGKKVFLYLQGEHPDFIYLRPEKDEIKIDQVRGVRDFLNLKPALSQKKVVLIAPAESMNPYSQNALLKTLEEPPQDTHFILVANNLDNILSTVRSRCYLVEFRELSKEDIKNITGIRDEEILELCEGSITKASELLHKTHIIKLAKLVLSGSALELYSASSQVEKMDYDDQKLFLELLGTMLHKKLLQDKEKWEFYEPIIDRIAFVLDNLKRGVKLSLFLFCVNISLTEVKK